MNGDRRFRLFANCIPVRGARRSVICDLQRGSYRFIPNGLYDILTAYPDRTLDEIRADFEATEHEIIDEYFDFLLRHELGFWCEEPERFPALDLSWEVPQRITNAIIDLDASSEHQHPSAFAQLITQLDDLGCRALELRVFAGLEPSRLPALLATCQRSRLRSIDLLTPYQEGMLDDDWQQLCQQHPRLSQIVIHSAPETRRIRVEGTGVPIHYRREHINAPSCCGQVHPGYFVCNLKMFTEAQTHNTCLNRKLAVDAGGEIKNCPSMPRSFGNVRETSLHSALAHRDFPRWWRVHKDQIDVCKDCEFRYLCTDCRAYLSDRDNLLSKPAKCTYDPYTASWGSAS